MHQPIFLILSLSGSVQVTDLLPTVYTRKIAQFKMRRCCILNRLQVVPSPIVCRFLLLGTWDTTCSSEPHSIRNLFHSSMEVFLLQNQRSNPRLVCTLF